MTEPTVLEPEIAGRIVGTGPEAVRGIEISLLNLNAEPAEFVAITLDLMITQMLQLLL